jgi:alkanesulfonate monooxygenase
MGRTADRLRLGAFLPATGHHIAAWRHPSAAADAGANFGHYADLARTAERAKFDAIFLADSDAVLDQDPEIMSRTSRATHFEPLTLLSALAAMTERIGLIATVSTTYNEPYYVARKFASLDLISGGRSGWNVVTSGAAAAALNFSRAEHPDHADRYDRAREFVAVVQGLWDSWEDDSFLLDKAAGRYFSPDKLHVLNHRGAHFAVRGPLNVARSPQGHPVIVQAGASEPGKMLAAATAELVFTASRTLAEAKSYYDDVKNRLSRHGRSADDLKIMPGIYAVIGASTQEAEEKYEELQALIHPTVGLSLLSALAGGIDLSAYPLDGPLPDLPETSVNKSRQKLVVDLARRDNLTIRQLYETLAGARGHFTMWGTPRQVADEIEAWFTGGAADGFNVMPPHLPDGLDAFAERVIPELQRRGLFRTEYEGRTLRENLGLSRPANRFAQPFAASA